MKEEEGEKEANGHHQRSVGWWAIVSLPTLGASQKEWGSNEVEIF